MEVTVKKIDGKFADRTSKGVMEHRREVSRALTESERMDGAVAIMDEYDEALVELAK